MSLNYQEFRIKVREFIAANMISGGDRTVSDSENIFQNGYVTSIFAMRLLNFIEDINKITIDDEEISLTNFSSVDAMVKLVERHNALT